MKNRPWTDEDDALLRREYDRLPGPELAARLGRALSATYHHAHKLGLKKTVRRDTPGRRPHNYAPIGTIRKGSGRGHLFMKVAEGGWPDAWAPLHHLVWEAAHGPIPPDSVVGFRDGNAENTALDNLALVAKADWIKRYIPERTLPPEVAQLVRLKAVLTRHINRRKDDEQQD